MQKVFKKSTFQALPSVLFFLRNEAQLSEKYQRRRPGWCKEKYYIKIQKYRKVPLTVSWLVHMSSARRGSCATNPHSFCNQPFSNHSDHLQPLFWNMYILLFNKCRVVEKVAPEFKKESKTQVRRIVNLLFSKHPSLFIFPDLFLGKPSKLSI